MAISRRSKRRASGVSLPRGRAKTAPATTSRAPDNRLAPVDHQFWAPLSKLTPYAKNPRLHSPEQVEQIAASMREFGQTQLVVVDERGEIIAGHGRVLAAEKLGIKALKVGVARGWSEAQRKAYRIADNQLTIASRWDDVLLREQFNELRLEDYDVNLLGFEEGYLSSMLLLDPEHGANDPYEQYVGMPDYEQLDQTPHRSILVHFASQKDVDAFAKLFPAQPVTDKTKWVWYPTAPERGVFADKLWVSDKK